jgi:hypothetical protein
MKSKEFDFPASAARFQDGILCPLADQVEIKAA